MFGIFGRDYTRCPHFDRRHEDSGKIKELEDGHAMIISELKVMKKLSKDKHNYLKKHMEDEAEHHAKTNEVISDTNESIAQLVGVVQTLVDDKQSRDIDEAVDARLEKEAKPRKARWNKVIMTALGVITTAIVTGIIGAVWFGIKMYATLYGVE